MRPVQWIIVLILIGIYSVTSAEFYRYVDEEGKVIYTDDLTNVPSEQRDTAREYTDTSDQFAPRKQSEKEEQEKEGPQQAVKETEEDRLKKEATAKELKQKTLEKRLRETGKGLQKEYQALMKEKEELDKATKGPLTEAMRKQLIKRVRDYNSRTEDYEQRRNSFNKEVEAYNASIEKDMQEE